VNGLGTIKVVMDSASRRWPTLLGTTATPSLAGRPGTGRNPPPVGEPVLNDVTAEISRVDSTHVQMVSHVLASQGRQVSRPSTPCQRRVPSHQQR